MSSRRRCSEPFLALRSGAASADPRLDTGAGNAALTAALAARRAGCSVRVLEKAPQPFRGGNTRFTGGVFRFTYQGLGDLLPIVGDADDAADVVVDPYPPEAFARDLQRVTG